MFVTVTTGNYSGAFIALRPYQEDNAVAKPAQTLQSLFAVPLTFVFHRDHWGIEYAIDLSQVNAVNLEVLPALGFIPGDHALIVVTKRKPRQSFCGYTLSLASFLGILTQRTIVHTLQK